VADLADRGRTFVDGFGDLVIVQIEHLAPELAIAAANLARDIGDRRPETDLIMVGVVHHIADDQVARTLVERYKQRLPTGSFLVLTHFVTGTEEARKMEEIFLGGDLKSGKFRTTEQIEAYFSGLELADPGVVFDPLWRPDEPVPSDMDDVFKVGVVGVAQVSDLSAGDQGAVDASAIGFVLKVRTARRRRRCCRRRASYRSWRRRSCSAMSPRWRSATRSPRRCR
jgi:hypothetical protein